MMGDPKGEKRTFFIPGISFSHNVAMASTKCSPLAIQRGPDLEPPVGGLLEPTCAITQGWIVLHTVFL